MKTSPALLSKSFSFLHRACAASVLAFVLGVGSSPAAETPSTFNIQGVKDYLLGMEAKMAQSHASISLDPWKRR